jgi:hypothetical protein
MVREVRVAGIATAVDDADRDALACEAGRTKGGRAHRVTRRRVEQLDPLVGVDVVRPAGRHGGLERRDGALHERQGQVLHRLHGQAESPEPRSLRSRGDGVEGCDSPHHG